MEGKENLPSKRPAPEVGPEVPAPVPDFFDVTDDGPEVVEEIEEGALGEAGRNWPRPPAAPLDASRDKLGASGISWGWLAGNGKQPGNVLCLNSAMPKTHCSVPAAGAGLHLWAPQQAVLQCAAAGGPHHPHVWSHRARCGGEEGCF